MATSENQDSNLFLQSGHQLHHIPLLLTDDDEPIASENTEEEFDGASAERLRKEDRIMRDLSQIRRQDNSENMRDSGSSNFSDGDGNDMLDGLQQDLWQDQISKLTGQALVSGRESNCLEQEQKLVERYSKPSGRSYRPGLEIQENDGDQEESLDPARMANAHLEEDDADHRPDENLYSEMASQKEVEPRSPSASQFGNDLDMNPMAAAELEASPPAYPSFREPEGFASGRHSSDRIEEVDQSEHQRMASESRVGSIEANSATERGIVMSGTTDTLARHTQEGITLKMNSFEASENHQRVAKLETG